MPVNGVDASASATNMSSAGEKLTSLSLASASAGADEADFGEAFQPHVDTKQIHVLPESSTSGKRIGSRILGFPCELWVDSSIFLRRFECAHNIIGATSGSIEKQAVYCKLTGSRQSKPANGGQK